MLKYNNLSVVQNIYGNVIAFIGDRSLEGRLWIFNITRDKPWSWPGIKLLSNPIEMKTHLSQEENLHAMWDTIGRTHLTTVKFPRLAVVPYAVVEWISKNGLTPNELRVWLEKLMKTDVDSKKDD